MVWRTTEEWEAHVGSQVRRARLDASLRQDELADRAGVSVGAVRGLERGAGSSLKTLIRTARVLGRDDWLGSFAPAPGVEPLEMLRGLRSPRQKVYRARKPDTDARHRALPLPTVLADGRHPVR
ncbi:MAG: helix-turn-helix domain-containing protein [Acidimicrobiia bacterium]